MWGLALKAIEWIVGLFHAKEPTVSSLAADATSAHDQLAQQEAANAIQRTSADAGASADARIVRVVTDAPSHDDTTVNEALRKQFPDQFRD